MYIELNLLYFLDEFRIKDEYEYFCVVVIEVKCYLK